MKHTKRYAVAAATVAVLLSITACGGAEVELLPGRMTRRRSSLESSRTSPAPPATWAPPTNEGMLGYIDWINAKGGIEGRKLEAMSNDYAYKVPAAEDLYKKYVAANAVLIQGWGTGDSEALRKKVASDTLPFMSASYAEVLTDPKESPYNFVVAPTYSDQMRVALNWIAKDAGGKAEVAVFHSDSPFGTAPVADGQKWITEKSLLWASRPTRCPRPRTRPACSPVQRSRARSTS